jgi:hypothetical protein
VNGKIFGRGYCKIFPQEYNVVKSKKIDEREPVYFLVIKSNFFDHKKRE